MHKPWQSPSARADIRMIIRRHRLSACYYSNKYVLFHADSRKQRFVITRFTLYRKVVEWVFSGREKNNLHLKPQLLPYCRAQRGCHPEVVCQFQSGASRYCSARFTGPITECAPHMHPHYRHRKPEGCSRTIHRGEGRRRGLREIPPLRSGSLERRSLRFLKAADYLQPLAKLF